MDKVALGKRIKRLREAAGLTQGQLADLALTTQRSVSNWETGATHPRNKIGALERIFGVPLDGPDQTPEPADQVETAIESSPRLTEPNKLRLKAEYYELRDKGLGEVRGA
jgi:transcriptional regulator with XRE-family HTH domain